MQVFKPYDTVNAAIENTAWWFNSAASWVRIEAITDSPYRHAYDDLNHAYRHLHKVMGYRPGTAEY